MKKIFIRCAAFAVVSMAVVSFFSGCSTGVKEQPDLETVTNVVRVFMRQSDEWSLMVVDPKTGVMTVRNFDLNCCQGVRLIADVPANSVMWARVEWVEGRRPYDAVSLEIHVHSASDVNGAGWDRGKGGRGQINIVE